MSGAEAYFLGPRAENASEFQNLIVAALRDHVEWRRTYHDDPPYIKSHYPEHTARLQDELQNLLQMLRKSVPFFSPRHQGHMTWETTMPALVGYFAAMLANPNNVAFEGSPATSVLERWVGQDLCEMLGFPRETSWGHLTSGGSVANLEAFWALRDVRLHAMTLSDDPWEGANLLLQTILDHPPTHVSLRQAPLEPVYLASGAVHHSLEKAATILGVGPHAIKRIPLDPKGRMDTRELRKALQKHRDAQIPIYAVALNIGSTEFGAIDPVLEVLELQQEFGFPIHADGAWGGYHASVCRDDFPMHRDGDPMPLPPSLANPTRLTPYAEEQMLALKNVDTVTVDPHKSGYVPYSAGAMCYRDARLRTYTSFTGAYAFHGDEVRNIGIFGVEGSKAGATAAAVYLSHALLRPSKSGLGAVIGQALSACHEFQRRLEALHGITCLPVDQPDQNILIYHYNPPGNQSLERANHLNRQIYDRLSLDQNEHPPLILSTTVLEEERLGKPFLDAYKARIFQGSTPEGDLTVLRSVVMNPWTTPYLDLIMSILQKTLQELT